MRSTGGGSSASANGPSPFASAPRQLVGGRLATNDQALQMALARRGMAIAMTLRAFVRGELDRGQLVAVLPEALGSSTGLSAVFTEKERMQPRVRVFIDHLAEFFADASMEQMLGA